MYLFCGQGLKAAQRLICLGIYPNGDWRNRVDVELYVTQADLIKYGEDMLKNMCAHGVSYSLVGAAPKDCWAESADPDGMSFARG
eukprot:8039814-Pyramimonas_sp.AAC.1